MFFDHNRAGKWRSRHDSATILHEMPACIVLVKSDTPLCSVAGWCSQETSVKYIRNRRNVMNMSSQKSKMEDSGWSFVEMNVDPIIHPLGLVLIPNTLIKRSKIHNIRNIRKIRNPIICSGFFVRSCTGSCIEHACIPTPDGPWIMSSHSASWLAELRLAAKFSGHFRISDIEDFGRILNYLEWNLGSGGVPLDSSWSWDSFWPILSPGSAFSIHFHPDSKILELFREDCMAWKPGIYRVCDRVGQIRTSTVFQAGPKSCALKNHADWWWFHTEFSIFRPCYARLRLLIFNWFF